MNNMEKVITDFSDFIGGWMKMYLWDYRTNEERPIRVSYIQDFFDDLLMMCRYLTSSITGIYEVFIDQEGFDSSIKINKYQTGSNAIVSIEIRTPIFEDEEYPYNEDFTDNWLYYNEISIKDFVKNILFLIDKYKNDYNEGFILSSSHKLNEKLFYKAKKEYNIFLKEVNYEKISNT